MHCCLTSLLWGYFTFLLYWFHWTIHQARWNMQSMALLSSWSLSWHMLHPRNLQSCQIRKCNFPWASHFHFHLHFSSPVLLTKTLYRNVIATTTCFGHTVAMKLCRTMRIFQSEVWILNTRQTSLLTHLWFNSCCRICVGLICSWRVLCCPTPFQRLGFPWNYSRNGI